MLRQLRGRGVRAVAGAAALVACAMPAAGQVRVNPTGVNVSSQTATTVFLTFGGLAGYRPVEAVWCGDLVPATPALGQRCNPATIYGALPLRYNLGTGSGQDAFTDIMSIPASVVRRAYQDAEAGRSSEFYYVRRFVRSGSPDQYVAVTCRLAGGGARVPLSLVDVRLSFAVDTPILHVAPGGGLPPLSAEVVFTGSGRLQGRWEVVLPGQELPEQADLLSEASLPAERRATQRRYMEVGRFNVFLDPIGRYRLPGPDPERLPTGVEGQYVVLLRIEASDEREGSSDLSAVGAGPGLLRAGAAAGFAMPTLRYLVGAGRSDLSASPTVATALLPTDGAAVAASVPVELRWRAAGAALYHRVEIEQAGQLIHAAIVAPGGEALSYALPPFVASRGVGAGLRWRVVTILPSGRDGERTAWYRLVIE